MQILRVARISTTAIFGLLLAASAVLSFFRTIPFLAPTGNTWRILNDTCPTDRTIFTNANLSAHLPHNRSVTDAQLKAWKITNISSDACIQTTHYAYGPADRQPGSGVYSTYLYNLFFYATPTATSALNAFRADMIAACPNTTAQDRHSAVIEQSWNLGTFYASPLLQDKTYVNTWDMVLIIFGISFLCEIIRLRSAQEGTPALRALRWAEYALTSPFILVIIALSGFVRDRNVLVLLFTGQLALIPYGYAIEAEFERNHSTAWSLGLTALFVPAWAVHGLLWFVLARMSEHNISAALPCNGWRDNDAQAQYERFQFIFYILLYGEIVLFTLFGLVFPVVWVWWRGKQVKGAQPDFEAFWAASEVGYSVLNVSSKALLFVLCILIVTNQPPELVLR